MNMKRQRGRNIGRNKPHMGGPVRSQTFDSSGPDVRIRGNAYQVLEKYLALARDATAAGDRIAAENFYQHAEHYFRTINASQDGHRPQMGGQPHHQHQQQHGGQHPQQHQPQMNGVGGHDGQPQQAGDPGAGPQPLAGPYGGPSQGDPQQR